MKLKLNVAEYAVADDCQYFSDLLDDGKKFPILSIGRDSYIEEAFVDSVLDDRLIYNLQVGRYSAIAHDVTFVIDMNHDYKRCAQGRISGAVYKRPEHIKRKGQIVIMNDCWIGEKATIMSGVTIGNGAVVAACSVVTKDVPPYVIVGGNPAKVIGYRFEKQEVEALNYIRWWNWPSEKVLENAEILYSDVSAVIDKYYNSSKEEMSSVSPVDIAPIEKINSGEKKSILYVPDFDQQYPTYLNVIEAFVSAYNNTNTDLLLYIKQDDLLAPKLQILNKIFEKYDWANCYVNTYVGNVEDKKSLLCRADAYITNRSRDNVEYMDAADFYSVPVISGVDLPIFDTENIGK